MPRNAYVCKPHAFAALLVVAHVSAKASPGSAAGEAAAANRTDAQNMERLREQLLQHPAMQQPPPVATPPAKEVTSAAGLSNGPPPHLQPPPEAREEWNVTSWNAPLEKRNATAPLGTHSAVSPHRETDTPPEMAPIVHGGVRTKGPQAVELPASGFEIGSLMMPLMLLSAVMAALCGWVVFKQLTSPRSMPPPLLADTELGEGEPVDAGMDAGADAALWMGGGHSQARQLTWGEMSSMPAGFSQF